MELKVWVDNVERSVSGVTDNTTCTQLIYALAHATGQKGKFVLVECYKNHERSLCPTDCPLRMQRRWRERQGDVTYQLRRIDTDLDEASESSATTDSSARCFSQRESSASSIASANVPYIPPMAARQQSSTASLPAYSEASLQRRRPPPPDYNSTMERKMAGIARTSEMAKSGGIIAAAQRTLPIAELQLTPDDLMTLVQKQDGILEEQRTRLKLSEMTMKNEEQREFVQLDAQQKNLRRVLESLRKADWGRQYEEETLKNRQLRAKMLATQEKLSLIHESRNVLSGQEAELWQELHDLAQEDSSLFNTPEGVAFPFVNNNEQITRIHSAI